MRCQILLSICLCSVCSELSNTPEVFSLSSSPYELDTLPVVSHRSRRGTLQQRLTGLTTKETTAAETRRGRGRGRGRDTQRTAAEAHRTRGVYTDHPHYMDCGTAPLCGVLVLESGMGTGYYRHAEPTVHGLWPETGHFGTSKCIHPSKRRWSGRTARCYAGSGASAQWFEQHEWQKHGECAGVEDANSYFTQICTLSAAPLALMRRVKLAGGSLAAMARAVAQQDFFVWYMESNVQSQIFLYACSRGGDSAWQLASPAAFNEQCGGGLSSPSHHRDSRSESERESQPVHSHRSCVPNRHGPKCEIDRDCVHVDSCTRCANSGFCTCVDIETGRCD